MLSASLHSIFSALFLSAPFSVALAAIDLGVRERAFAQSLQASSLDAVFAAPCVVWRRK